MLDAVSTLPSISAQIAAAPAYCRPRMAKEAGLKPVRAPAHDARTLWEAAWSEVRTPSSSWSLTALRGRIPMRRGAGLDLLDRDPDAGLVLVGCDGWRQYSRAYGQRLPAWVDRGGRSSRGLRARDRLPAYR